MQSELIEKKLLLIEKSFVRKAIVIETTLDLITKYP